jgi:hypothetical protein
MEHKTLTREELYGRVWTTPMRRLAQEFGVSDGGLAKICRRHDIPTPPVGYWAKKEYGKPVEQTPLPNAKEGTPQTVEIVEQPPRPALSSQPEPSAQDPAIARLIAEVSKPENKVVVADTLHSPHPLVVATRKALEEAQPDKYGLLSPTWQHADRCLNVTVSKGAVTRDLLQVPTAQGLVLHVVVHQLLDQLFGSLGVPLLVFDLGLQLHLEYVEAGLLGTLRFHVVRPLDVRALPPAVALQTLVDQRPERLLRFLALAISARASSAISSPSSICARVCGEKCRRVFADRTSLIGSGPVRMIAE